MPELPEVTIVAEGLHKLAHDLTLNDITIFNNFEPKMGKRLAEFKAALPLKLKEVRNKGKNIYFVFYEKDDQTWAFMNHLLMTGKWIINAEPNKHNHVTLNFDKLTLTFNDYRRLGQDSNLSFDFMKYDDLVKELDDIMPSIWETTYPVFKENLKARKNSMIYPLLLRQRKSDNAVLSGVGNYIANEVLYRAKILPRRLVKDMTDTEINLLYKAILKVCTDSYNKHGASTRDYVDIEGNEGTYHEEFQVYGRKKDPLGNPVVNEKIGSRMTHYVKEVQN